MEKSRTYGIILYPDSTNYDYESIISFALSSYKECMWILHDKDIYQYNVTDSETGEIIHLAGDAKKPHIHLLFKLDNPRSINSIAKELSIPENMVEHIKKWKASVRYLIHMDDEDKYQYDKKLIKSNCPISKYLRDEREECVIFGEIVNFIRDNTVTNPFVLAEYISKHPDAFTVFRRSSAWFSSCLAYNRDIVKGHASYVNKSDVVFEA